MKMNIKKGKEEGRNQKKKRKKEKLSGGVGVGDVGKKAGFNPQTLGLQISGFDHFPIILRAFI